jgi:hypothetical protein
MDFYIVIPGNTPWKTHLRYSQAIKESIGVLLMDVDPPLYVDSGPIRFARPRTMHVDNSILPAILARQPVVIEIDETQRILSEIENTVLRRNAPMGRRAQAELVIPHRIDIISRDARTAIAKKCKVG